MVRKYIPILGLSILLGFTTAVWAGDGRDGDREVDTRVYLAPMLEYGQFDEDSYDPADEFGARLGIGKNLTGYLALELYAFNYSSVELDTNADEMDTTGYGLGALLFPARDLLPVFGIVGAGKGTYEIDNARFPANVDDQDSKFIELGVGFLAPLPVFDMALRGEYRYRSNDVDSPGGGEFKFRDNVFSLGVQIPLGSGPEETGEPAAPLPEPTPASEPLPKAEPRDNDGDSVPDEFDRCPETPAETEVDRQGCPVDKDPEPFVLHGVSFEPGSARLTPAAERRLDEFIDTLRKKLNARVRIEGHTDSTGSAARNLELSRERAEAVRDYLARQGVNADRLETRGYGETRPLVPNTKSDGSDDPEARARNRRVELHIVAE